jgi:hypothetical protein
MCIKGIDFTSVCVIFAWIMGLLQDSGIFVCFLLLEKLWWYIIFEACSSKCMEWRRRDSYYRLN